MAITVREVVQNSSEGITSVNLGAGTQAGDVLLLTNGTDFFTAAEMGTPSGGGTWSQVALADRGTNDFHLRAWVAVATSGGAQSVSVAQSGNDACNHVRVRVLADADTEDPIDAAASEDDNGIVCPSVTTTGEDSLLCCDLIGPDGDYTTPAGMTGEAEQDCGGFSTSDGAHEQLASSGATGTRTWTGPSVSGALTTIAVRTASGATDLTVADASHTQTADSPTLTQVHEIAVASATHGQTADSPGLTQVHEVTAAAALHAQTADDPGLTQVHELAAVDAEHSQVADDAALSQVHTLTAEDTTHGQTAGSPTLAQVYVIASSSALHAQAADAAALTQLHQLVVADATHAQTADEPTVSGDTPVVPGDLTPGSDRPTLAAAGTRPSLTSGATRPVLTPGRLPDGQ